METNQIKSCTDNKRLRYAWSTKLYMFVFIFVCISETWHPTGWILASFICEKNEEKRRNFAQQRHYICEKKNQSILTLSNYLHNASQLWQSTQIFPVLCLFTVCVCVCMCGHFSVYLHSIFVWPSNFAFITRRAYKSEEICGKKRCLMFLLSHPLVDVSFVANFFFFILDFCSSYRDFISFYFVQNDRPGTSTHTLCYLKFVCAKYTWIIGFRSFSQKVNLLFSFRRNPLKIEKTLEKPTMSTTIYVFFLQNIYIKPNST